MNAAHVLDYDSYYQRLLTGARATWHELRQSRPDESFYLFGFSTDSDTTDLILFANTEEQFAGENDSPEYPILKWCVNEESELHHVGRKHIDDLAKEINRFVFEPDPSEAAFEDRKARLMQIFEQVLVELDSEGLFGQGEERQQMMLLLDIVDPGEQEWEYMTEVLQRINPPESVNTYLQLLEEMQEE
ncbi:hypothetical protein Pan153_32150 [Gimesia panareensis]|uniref:DUF4303 domain-containing protein n=1 Tax=Gimesia panareensis TaxID=2527978 RepID=A0A518FQC8_9PLAN|nr:DUF4303 domain-containing protein [Gimesia panareensis]QDV18556.1 hypothetical protein Pan153_32150 [Gimesia panareensis]